MPIFTRRRLENMLEELAPWLNSEKVRDLLSRLDNKRVEQALPAEAELSLLWALSRLGDMDVEPAWWGDEHRPEAYCENLLSNQPAVVEIAATNDNRLSGHAEMHRVALAISDYANRVRTGSGKFLHFSFRVESGFHNGVYFRRRLVPPTYKLTQNEETRVRIWLTSGQSERAPLHICELGLDVQVEMMKHKQSRFHNFWSPMPVEVHSVEQNPFYELLHRKLDQLKAAPANAARLIFLMDVGSQLLNRMGTFSEHYLWSRCISIRDIVQHFVTRYRDGVDAVVIFVPRGSIPKRTPHWEVTIVNRPGWTLERAAIDKLASFLPSPRFEGYQVRSLFLQGAFSPTARGWYMGTKGKSLGHDLEMKISARALLDLLAGRITAEHFHHVNGQRPGEKNLFKHWLDLGFTLSGLHIEAGGTDQDDDWVVVSFKNDPAARALKLTSKD